MSPPKKAVPKKEASPTKKRASPPKNESTKLPSPPRKEQSPPKSVASPPAEPARQKESLPAHSPPKREVASPPVPAPLKVIDVRSENSVAALASRIEAASPPKKEVISPPIKINRNNSKTEENGASGKSIKREDSAVKKIPQKGDKLSMTGDDGGSDEIKTVNNDQTDLKKDTEDGKAKNEESNGVGDKIKKFEKAAEDASTNTGKLSRTNSMRGRSRTDRIGSDSEFPPPATPFKDNVHFDLTPAEKTGCTHHPPERQQSFSKSNPVLKWPRSDSHEEKIQKPEPLKIIKPEFKQMPSPADLTIRSPSVVGGKAASAVQFPSHGTAFRNVAPPDTARAAPHKFNEEVNTQSNFKQCKAKPKKEYSISKGSSYFTRGSEEIWLVKKKDIEEIEERVLDSFRRAGGNVCMRSESMRPSSDSGQGAAFAHATMGRNKRQMYSRSESLDPQWASGRAHTLKRQTSVACTCGHDKKSRPKTASANETVRPRSRSHGDDHQSHVLDKYETLV